MQEFGDGFDLYSYYTDAIAGGTPWQAGSTPSGMVLTAGRFPNSQGINCGNGGQYVYKNSGNNDAVHHFSFAYQQNATLSGTTAYFYIELTDGGTAQCTLQMLSNGSMVLFSGAPNSGTILATYAGAILATGIWYQFEVEVVINNTTGSITVRKNGNPSNDFQATSLNTRAGTTNNYAQQIYLGSSFGANNNIDDFLWRSDPASVPFLGDIRCYTRRPGTDVSVQYTKPSTINLQPFTAAIMAANNYNQGITSGQARYQGFMSQGGTIGSVVVSLVVGYTGHMNCAIYAAVGTYPNIFPITVIQAASAAITNPVSGNNTFTFSPAVTIPKGTPFFVAVISDTSVGSAWLSANSTPYPFYNCSLYANSITYSTFPLTAPATSSIFTTSVSSMSVVVTPTYNADCVADWNNDGTNSAITDATVNDNDLYNLQSASISPSSIYMVTVKGSFQKTDAGTRNVEMQLKSGTTTVSSPSVALNTSFAWVTQNYLTDPNTGSAWLSAAVSAIELGPVTSA